MVPPGKLGGFVCLRCWLSLVGRAKGTRPRATAVQSHSRAIRSYANDATVHHARKEDEGRVLDMRNTGGARTAGWSLSPNASRLRETPRSQQRRATEVYRSRGQRLVPRNEDLPINILGEPAHAIVMRDAGAWSGNASLPQSEPEEPQSHGGTLEAIERQLGETSSTGAWKHIEELRPPNNRALTQDEFEKLKQTLVNGFTKVQLEDYISHHQDTRTAPVSIDADLDQLPWAVEQWPWAPAASDGLLVKDPIFHGYLDKSATTKERLALRLIRQLWGISSQAVESLPGVLDIRLRDLEFRLVSTTDWLQRIMAPLLGDSGLVEVIHSESIVHILAPKNAAETALREISKSLDTMQTRDVRLKSGNLALLPAAALEELGRLTNTVIESSTTKDQMRVYWIASPDHNAQHEDLGDVVSRLLLVAFTPRERAEFQLASVPKQHRRKGRFVNSFPDKAKLAWKDRMLTWARWTRPTKPEDDLKLVALDRDALAYTLGDEQLLVTEQSASSSPVWSTTAKTSTVATLGHVLFDQNPSNRLDRPMPGTPRVLLPVIPPLSSLASHATLPQPGLDSSTILMRFLPVPDAINKDVDAVPARFLPALELRLAVSTSDHGGSDSVDILSLRAIVAKSTVINDLLVPSGPVDARLVQTRYFDLLFPAVRPGQAVEDGAAPAPRDDDERPEDAHGRSQDGSDPVLAFLRASTLRPTDGLLKTPARLGPTTLPTRLLGSVPPSHSDIVAKEAVTATYVFAGLEMQRSVATAFDGWRLVYTSVGAGKGGGWRAELTLEGVRAVDDTTGANSDRGDMSVTASQERDADEYLSALTKILQGEDLQWFRNTTDLK